MKNWAATAALCLLATTASAAVPFYESMLTRGVSSAQRGEYDKALRELRIAAFGTIDDLPQYQLAQLWIALASERTGRPGEARIAASKLLQAERVVPTYAALTIDSATRQEFEKIVTTGVDPMHLAGVPVFNKGRAATPQTTTRPPVAQKKPEPKPEVVQTRPAQAPPPAAVTTKPAIAPTTTPATTEIKPAPRQEPAKPVEKPVVETPKPVATKPATTTPPAATRPAPAPTQAPAPAKPQTSELDERLRDAQRLLNEGKILAAREAYLQLSTRRPLTRAQLLEVGKGLNRVSSWPESAAIYQRAYPLQAGEELHMFYEAINRYQLGELSIARALLARALPALPNSREVMIYRPRIESGL